MNKVFAEQDTAVSGARRIVLASGNAAKRAEIERLLAGRAVEVVPQSDLFDGQAAETGMTFAENALIKARFAAERSGLPSLADDSGLEVDALGGAPGIHSARFAGPGASDADNLRRLLEALDGVPDERRTARFRCVICFLCHAVDPQPVFCEGVWEGRIARQPRGSNGFGYDPVFLPGDGPLTAAELDPAVKNMQSHRGQALSAWARRFAPPPASPAARR